MFPFEMAVHIIYILGNICAQKFLTRGRKKGRIYQRVTSKKLYRILIRKLHYQDVLTKD
jgi:hypothetical protein